MSTKPQLKVTILGTLMMLIATHAYADDCQKIRDGIKNLPARGGTVKIEKGVYNCSSAIIIDRSHVKLIGAGQDNVTIKLADGSHAPIIIIGNTTILKNEVGNFVVKKRVKDIQVSGFTIDGRRSTHDVTKECGDHSCDGDISSVRNNGITIRGASYVTVSDVTAHSMISGGLVTEKYCDHLIVRNFSSYDNFFDGLAGYETEKSEFSNLHLHDNKGAGISIDINFNNNIIRDSKIAHNGDVGIFGRHIRGNQFNSLDVFLSGSFGIFLAKDLQTCAEDNTFKDVNIIGSRGAPIRMNDDCKGNKIIGISYLCHNFVSGVSEKLPGAIQVGDLVQCSTETSK